MLQISQGHEVFLALLVLLLPLVSFFIMISIRERSEVLISSVAITISAVTFFIALFLSINLIVGEHVASQLTWFTLGDELTFSIGVLLDKLTGVMLTVITFIAFMVCLFSKHYMSGDKEYAKYYGLLGLFTFSMLGIVVADNLFLLFIFWELVGFTSYLLIGFWYQKTSAVNASKKAFIVNRIGDLGFVIAIMILWTEYGSLDFLILQEIGYQDSLWVGVAGIGLLAAVMGKSAQFPLQIWLPDAMEGPTPVSALIHAATMVAAGIFLLARVFVLLSPQTLDVIVIIGAITAFMGAIAAIRQYDIKKVLAFSTISQLGYMVLGIGIGATGGALFHLVTHAFFKACLFLSAGAVIHRMHQQHDRGVDVQDMRSMGGLRKNLPIVFVTFLLSAMSLTGLPLMSGFLSKDAILTAVFQWTLDSGSIVSVLVMALSYGSVLLTGYYMTRQVILVFLGEARIMPSKERTQLPMTMIISLVLLGAGATWLLYSPNPLNLRSSWLMTLFESDFERNIPSNIHSMVFIMALLLSVGGIGLGYLKFRNYKETNNDSRFVAIINKVSANNWYLDQIYRVTFVQLVLKFSSFTSAVEVHFIDRLVNYLGIFQVVLSRIIGWSDKHVIDGVVQLTVTGVYGVGKIVKGAQGDNVQRYILTALISFIFIVGGLAFYFLK